MEERWKRKKGRGLERMEDGGDGRLNKGGMKGNVRKNGGKIEVDYRKDDKCLKKQKCLSPEVERVRQL
jgi:hypothetical protein